MFPILKSIEKSKTMIESAKRDISGNWSPKNWKREKDINLLLFFFSILWASFFFHFSFYFWAKIAGPRKIVGQLGRPMWTNRGTSVSFIWGFSTIGSKSPNNRIGQIRFGRAGPSKIESDPILLFGDLKPTLLNAQINLVIYNQMFRNVTKHLVVITEFFIFIVRWNRTF